MIKRIIFGILFFLLILALILKFMGINQLDLYNEGYRGFINRLAYSFNQYSEIQIPTFHYLGEVYPDTTGILEVLINIADGFLSFIDCIRIFINVLIRLFMFLYAFVSAILSFPSYVS